MKRQSTAIKRDSAEYATPIKEGNRTNKTLSNLEGQLSSSKNNIRELQRLNEDLKK